MVRPSINLDPHRTWIEEQVYAGIPIITILDELKRVHNLTV